MTITEALDISNSPRSLFNRLDRYYGACRTIKPLKNFNIDGTGKKLLLTPFADQSQGFKFDLKVKGFNVNEDLVIFRKGPTCGIVEFVSIGPLDLQQIESIASIAASKADSEAS